MVVRTLASLVLRHVLGWVGHGQSPNAKDVEIAVLRHQLAVLRRQVARPRYTPAERMVLATLEYLAFAHACGVPLPNQARDLGVAGDMLRDGVLKMNAFKLLRHSC